VAWKRILVRAKSGLGKNIPWRGQSEVTMIQKNTR